MTVVHEPPEIACVDLWPPGTLTKGKLSAYRSLMDAGDIRIRKVTYHRPGGYTTVEYLSNLPHAWTLQRLKEAMPP